MLQPLFFAYSCGEVLKTPRRQNKSLKKKIKKQLIDSLTISIVIEIEELNEKPNKVEKPKDAADIIKEFDEIVYAKGQQYNIQNKYF